jgi:hypothetical protein
MGCMRTKRDGSPCMRSRSFSYSVGPKGLTLCGFHKTKYEAEQVLKLQQVERDHGYGLHGEGEDRKVWTERHPDATGEFWLSCRKCRAEMESEEFGVRPDQVEEARRITRRMESDIQSYDETEKRFVSEVALNPTRAVRDYGSTLTRAYMVLGFWNRVKGYVGTENDGKKLTLVDGWEMVVEEVKENLVRDLYDSDEERKAASQWVRRMFF